MQHDHIMKKLIFVLLGKGWPHGPLVCYVLLCFGHFPMWCPGSPGSGVLLDRIDF